MTKRSEKTSPATPPSEKRDPVAKDNSPAEVKELSFEDTSIQFKNIGGKWRISLRELAEFYSIQFKHASEKLTLNPELFRDLEVGRVTRPGDNLALDYELSIRDAVSFLMLLPYKRYGDERGPKLIRMRNWLTDNAEKILTGEVPSVFPGMDIDSLGYGKKDLSPLNGLRLSALKHLAKRNHPSSPNTVNRAIATFRNDHQVMKGHQEMEKNWRRELQEPERRKLQAHVAIDFAALANGHLELDERMKYEQAMFRDICPELRPDFLPVQIETTRQMKLIGGDES
ncbi:MAG: hypothetical protein LUQ50_12230 [Methanospirillum sp.]|uniref:hypothetical protein n=1 Tax=Methanospirillum sp. TaxID=45200 RepID=UPI002373FDBB|nr:hypothetical protein [Methanospirillum sp.]MDD1729824.1 hypothetical protein [Methanospirillum sp.]